MSLNFNPYFDDGTDIRERPDLLLAGQAARLAGISRDVFLKYVRQGRVREAGRLSGGQRVYRRTAVLRLARKVGAQQFALSIHQPYASQIAARTKRYERRPWRIAENRLPFTFVVVSTLHKPAEPEYADLPRGVTIARVTVTKCIPMPEGKFAWLISHVEPLEPVAVRGYQRFFKIRECDVRLRLKKDSSMKSSPEC